VPEFMLGSELGLEAIKSEVLVLGAVHLDRVHEDAIGHNLKHFWSMKPKDTELCAATAEGERT